MGQMLLLLMMQYCGCVTYMYLAQVIKLQQIILWICFTELYGENNRLKSAHILATKGCPCDLIKRPSLLQAVY